MGIGVKYLVVALGVEPKTYSLNAFLNSQKRRELLQSHGASKFIA